VSLAYVASSSYMVLNGIFQKNLRMDKVAITELVGKIIQVSIVFLAVTRDWGFNAIMFAFLANMLFAFALVFTLSRKYVKFYPSFDLGYWKSFLKMSFPMGISAFVTFLYFKMDTIILSILKGSEAVGIYNMAYKIIENITFFPAMIVGLVLPLFSMYIFTDKINFKKIADKVAKIFFLITVPVVIGTLFLAEGIIGIIGGSDFLISANILRMLIFALAFIFFGHFFNVILLSANLQSKLMKILAFCAFFNISLNMFMISAYSYTGAAIVSVATELLVIILTSYVTYKYVGYKFSAKGWEKILFSGFAMGLFLFIFQDINSFLAAIGSAATYFLFLWISRAITVQEIKSIMASS
jgi:O-antigen/teichoic acid export membrane protein